MSSNTNMTTGEIIDRASKLAKQGRTAEATDLYNFVLKNFPYDKRARKGLKALKKKGKSVFRPQDLEAAISLVNANQLDAALSSARRLCKAHPEQAAVHNLLGIVLARCDRHDDALLAFNRALELDSEFVQAAANMAAAFTTVGRFDEALSLYHRLLHSGNGNADIYAGLGQALHGKQMYDDALEAYRRSLKMRALDADTLCEMGSVFNDMGRHDEAIDAYEQALGIDPHHRKALMNLGQCLLAMRRFNPAINVFSEYLALDAKDPVALGGLAKALSLTNQKTAAVEKFEELLQIQPDNGVAKHMAAALSGRRLEQADPDYARSLFESYAARFEDHLREDLEYNLPQKVPTVLQALDGEDAWYDNALDIGCGTGLVGTEIRSFCSHLVGIDVSTAMIQKAEEKAVYNELADTDIASWLKNQDRFFDLMICTDVIIYVGSLDPLLGQLAACMTPGARLVLSTERQEEGDFDLLQSGRFSHSDNYIRRMSEKVGLEVSLEEQIDLRKERGEWIEGSLFVLTKPQDSASV